MLLSLHRHTPRGNAVYGTCRILSSLGTTLAEVTTLENADYIIPAGTYTVCLTWSPRFRRPLPLVCGVPGRSAIRFHQGTRPEHSRGCILLSAGNLNRLIELTANALQDHEKVTLVITD